MTSTPDKPGVYISESSGADAFEPPLGTIQPCYDAAQPFVIAYMIKSSTGWVKADGRVFDPVAEPQLLELFTGYRPRPDFSWRHPIASRRAQRAWDAEDDHSYMIYGGTREEPQLPDFRARAIWGVDPATLPRRTRLQLLVARLRGKWRR